MSDDSELCPSIADRSMIFPRNIGRTIHQPTNAQIMHATPSKKDIVVREFATITTRQVIPPNAQVVITISQIAVEML